MSGSRPTDTGRMLVTLAIGGGVIVALILLAVAATIIADQSSSERVCRAERESARASLQSGEYDEAENALARANTPCINVWGSSLERDVESIRAEIVAARKKQLDDLRAGAPDVIAAAWGEVRTADAGIAARHADESALKRAQASIDTLQVLDPAPQGLAEVKEAIPLRNGQIKALSAFQEGDALVRSGNVLGADVKLTLAEQTLSSLPTPFLEEAGGKSLLADTRALRRRISRQVAAARKEQQEAEALAALCGDAPQLSPWDGGLDAGESYLKISAHDPGSIDLENCTVPRLTQTCWRTTCTVRGKNAFGALIATSMTFYVGRNDTILGVDE